MTSYLPTDASQVAELISWAVAEAQRFEIVAGRSKRSLGRPIGNQNILDVSQLAGIRDYEPAELILTALPGTQLTAIEAELEREGQMLAFEPPQWRDLLRSKGTPTLGGVLACNLAGSRRVRAGAERDFLLGVSAVNGRGEIWKAGGKVMKNVTGFDMCKLQCGAFGTLSVLTEVTMKVVPRPEVECTVLLEEASAPVAIGRMAAALNSTLEVSSAAYLPSAAARRCVSGAVSGAGNGFVALRLEGPQPSVAYRVEAMERQLGQSLRLPSAESSALWSTIREVRPFIPAGERVIWRICPTPSLAASFADEVRTRLSSTEAIYDWGGGLVWLSVDAEEAGEDAGSTIVRSALARVGGDSTLVVAPERIRRSTPIFEPLEGPAGDLVRRIKAGFDPGNVLNRGRLQEDF